MKPSFSASWPPGPSTRIGNHRLHATLAAVVQLSNFSAGGTYLYAFAHPLCLPVAPASSSRRNMDAKSPRPAQRAKESTLRANLHCNMQLIIHLITVLHDRSMHRYLPATGPYRANARPPPQTIGFKVWPAGAVMQSTKAVLTASRPLKLPCTISERSLRAKDTWKQHSRSVGVAQLRTDARLYAWRSVAMPATPAPQRSSPHVGSTSQPSEVGRPARRRLLRYLLEPFPRSLSPKVLKLRSVVHSNVFEESGF